jgi:hypothetical protein
LFVCRNSLWTLFMFFFSLFRWVSISCTHCLVKVDCYPVTLWSRKHSSQLRGAVHPYCGSGSSYMRVHDTCRDDAIPPCRRGSDTSRFHWLPIILLWVFFPSVICSFCFLFDILPIFHCWKGRPYIDIGTDFLNCAKCKLSCTTSGQKKKQHRLKNKEFLQCCCVYSTSGRYSLKGHLKVWWLFYIVGMFFYCLVRPLSYYRRFLV